MRKFSFLVFSILLLTFTVACEGAESNKESKDVEKKETKVSCSGPMMGDMYDDVEGIASDNMVIYATYDKEDKLTGIFYDYEFNLNEEFEGKALDTFKEGLNKICDNEIFSDCNVNVDGKKAVVHAQLDTSETESFDKETFKDEMQLLGNNWVCTEE